MSQKISLNNAVRQEEEENSKSCSAKVLKKSREKLEGFLECHIMKT